MARGHQVLALPMLGTALSWRARVAGAATAVPLARMMAECCERLLAMLQRYVSDMARALAPAALPHRSPAVYCHARVVTSVCLSALAC